MDRLPDRIDSKFRFVLLAAQRAERMMLGARPRVELPDHKPSKVAMEEISGDLVEWDYGPAVDSDEAGAESPEEPA